MASISDDQVHQLRAACVFWMGGSQPVDVIIQHLITDLGEAQGRFPSEDTSLSSEFFRTEIMNVLEEHVSTQADPFDAVLRQFLYFTTQELFLNEPQLKVLAEFLMANFPQPIVID